MTDTRRMMPPAIRKPLERIWREMQFHYGDYQEYTQLLDEFHTLAINDAQHFKPKPKREYPDTFKKKPKFHPAHAKAAESHKARKEDKGEDAAE